MVCRNIVSLVAWRVYNHKINYFFLFYSTLFPKKYPEFIAKFDELCKVSREKLPTDLDMIEFNEICSSYAEIIRIFPELNNFDYRHNVTL